MKNVFIWMVSISCVRHYLIWTLLFLLTSSGFSQVLNIDREISNDSSSKKNEFSGLLTLSSDKQKNNIIDFSTNLEFDRNFKNKYVLISYFRNDAVFYGKSNVQNEGLLHIRYRDRDTRKISPEEFVQFQWNGAWGLESRYLAGMNIRMKIL